MDQTKEVKFARWLPSWMSRNIPFYKHHLIPLPRGASFRTPKVAFGSAQLALKLWWHCNYGRVSLIRLWITVTSIHTVTSIYNYIGRFVCHRLLAWSSIQNSLVIPYTAYILLTRCLMCVYYGRIWWVWFGRWKIWKMESIMIHCPQHRTAKLVIRFVAGPLFSRGYFLKFLRMT